MQPRVLILTSNDYRQVYFTNEIGKHYKIVGIAVERKFSKGNRLFKFLRSVKYSPFKLSAKIYYKLKVIELDQRYAKTGMKMLLGAAEVKGFPQDADILETEDINSAEVENFIKNLQPDIILVSGTSLIRKNIIKVAPSKGIINMHTGLSPYYRGGPCTFWCLLNEEIEYLGVTIHYLTTGIDSGDIILSEREMYIEPGDNEATLDFKVIMRGVKLMVQAIRLIFDGKAPRVPQWIKGRNYLYKDFTPHIRLKLERKLKNGLIERWLLKNKGKSFDHIKEIRPFERGVTYVRDMR